MENISYYVAGHTGKGYVNYLDSNKENLKHVYKLKHPSHFVKTEIIRRIIAHFEQNHVVEVIYSSFGNKYLDGCIIREKSLAFFDNTIADKLDDAHIIELGKADEKDRQSNERVDAHLRAAYDHFSTGLKIHDSLEDIFVGQMDFDKADKVAASFINNILQNASKLNKDSYTYHRLFGTNTPNGAVNNVREILDGLKSSYFIKGRAGTGKSTFMKKVLAACREYGYDIELYHCSFDPESVDMVLVRDLNFCIFDSTDPHELDPQLEGEEIIDMYAETVKPGTDETYQKEIASVNSDYKSYMKKGSSEMFEVGQIMAEVDARHGLSGSRYKEIMEGIISRTKA